MRIGPKEGVNKRERPEGARICSGGVVGVDIFGSAWPRAPVEVLGRHPAKPVGTLPPPVICWQDGGPFSDR